MSTLQQIKRRQNALQRLEIQLAKGTKKQGRDEIISLSVGDISRIQKEIESLRGKV